MTETLTIDVHDWDFLVGRWSVRHRRLKARLAGSTEWEEFAGTLRQLAHARRQGQRG